MYAIHYTIALQYSRWAFCTHTPRHSADSARRHYGRLLLSAGASGRPRPVCSLFRLPGPRVRFVPVRSVVPQTAAYKCWRSARARPGFHRGACNVLRLQRATCAVATVLEICAQLCGAFQIGAALRSQIGVCVCVWLWQIGAGSQLCGGKFALAIRIYTAPFPN